MAIIALLAVEMASLRVASDGYVDLSRHLTIVMLAVATYLARYGYGGRAAWWFGFALVGWAYLALAVDGSARRGFVGATPISDGATPDHVPRAGHQGARRDRPVPDLD
jgi:hypothetical protein